MSNRGKDWMISFAIAVALAGRLLAGDHSAAVGPGWPPTDFKSILKDINEASFVVITYMDGSTAIVADAVWIDHLKRLMNSATGKPDKYCFCMNYPQIAFVNKDRKIANLETPHGTKFRFFNDHWLGDFVVDEKIVKQLNEMLEGQRKTAVSHTKPPSIPLPPLKLEIKFEGNQSSQPTPHKGG